MDGSNLPAPAGIVAEDRIDGLPRLDRARPGVLARLWADQASNGLFRQRPHWCARTGLHRRQVEIGLALAISAIAGIAALPSIASAAAMTLLNLGFAGLIILRLTAAILPPRWAPHQSLPDHALPRASIIIALYDEATVVERLVAALDRIDYPRQKTEIKLALEASDRKTLNALRRCRLDTRYEIVVVPQGSPQTKPRALNYALRRCNGDICTILDAEDRPHPQQLRRAAESFSAAPARLACLQAPLNWYNAGTNWLTRQFSLEYAGHFHALLPLYARLGWPLPLGGTSNYFRTDVLRRAGGWDAYNVTEDADLGFRLHALGYRSGVIAPMTLEEAPISFRAWHCQRTRWLKGYAQSLAVHTRPDTLAPSASFRIALIATLGAALVSATLHLPLVVICTILWLSGMFEGAAAYLVPACLSAGYLAGMISSAVGVHRAGMTWRWRDLITMPVYWTWQFGAAVRALKQLLQAPYYWDKTEHGLADAPETPCTSPCPPRSSPSASVLAFSSSPPGNRRNRRARRRGRV